VFAKTGAGWKQAAELKGSDTVAGDYFGGSVAISGTTIVAGAPVFTKEAGQAYVFTNTASGWKQATELKGSDTVAGDAFGDSVAISGTTPSRVPTATPRLPAGRTCSGPEESSGLSREGEVRHANGSPSTH
jgi:hypothetical protein